VAKIYLSFAIAVLLNTVAHTQDQDTLKTEKSLLEYSVTESKPTLQIFKVFQILYLDFRLFHQLDPKWISSNKLC
jgi:hypothetical protein